MDNAIFTLGKLFLNCYLLFSVYGSQFQYDVSIYNKVLNAADHWWTFDDTTSLYSIFDKVSETRASIRQGGAKLTRHETSRNNFLTLEGRSSSIQLGRFGKCIGDLTACTSGFTFSLWLRVRDTGGETQYILGSKDTLANGQGFSMLRTKHNKMKIVLRDARREIQISYSSSSGMWTHHLIIWNGQEFSIYLNGGQLKTERNEQQMDDHSLGRGKQGSNLREKRTIETGLFTLGRRDFKIDADYDDILFWNRNLNGTEATVMYYRDLDDPVITGCSSSASSVCIQWRLPNDIFNRIHSLSLVYHYLYQTEEPTHVALNSTAQQQCIGFLGSLATYFFKIKANIAGAMHAITSKVIQCRTTDGAPNAPNLSIKNKTATSIEVIWLTPSPANGAIIAYSVTVKEVKTKAVKVKIKMNAHENLPGRIGTYKLNVTNLARGTLYEIYVQALSVVGESSISTVQASTKGKPVTGTKPNTVKVIGDTMKIGWKPVKYAISYRVHVRPLNGNETSFDVISNSTELASLKPSTCYVINVQPIFSWGMGPRLVKNFKVKTPSQKIVPTGVMAIAKRWNQILIRWTPLMNSDVTYTVFLKSDDGTELSRKTRHHQIVFDNVMPLTTYSVYIQAKFGWGFGPRTFTNIIAKTKDIDECKELMTNRCDQNADCFNVEGSYLCQCRKGFVGNGFSCRPIPGDAKGVDFCKENTFRDISWPRIFKGGTAVRRCPNGTTGFASRKCIYDVSSQSSTYSLPNLSDCVSKSVIEFGNMVENPRASAKSISEQLVKVTGHDRLYGGDVKKTMVYYDKFISKRLDSNNLVQGLSQSVLDSGGNLLNDSALAAWQDLPKTDRSLGATKLFHGLETLAQKLATSYNQSTFEKTLSTRNIDMMMQRVSNASGELEYTEPNHSGGTGRQSRISLPTNEIFSQKGKKNVDVVYLAYANVNKVLGDESSTDTISQRTSVDVLNSKVLSATVVGADKINFESPVVLILPHLQEERVVNTSCVFWNISKSSGSKWLDTGCYVNHTNANETICHCYHLTNFAVLMTVSTTPALSQIPDHQFALRIITIIGLTISIIAMSIAFVTFCSFRFLHNARTTYHANLVASLILANLLFLIGVDKTSNKIACSMIAVLLHYFFTVAFVWMAMEGILLYFMLKKIFSSRNFLKRKRCCVICWVIPAVYVAILGALKIEHYGNSEFCWLSRKEGFIWSFVAPVSGALIVNFTVMGFAFQVMSEKRTKGPDDGTISDVWYWLKGLLVLSCLLGVTWILGVFYVDSNTIGFAYVFTLLNALQGLFIFIFHCFIDSRVRSEYMRLIKCQKRSEYNEKAGYSSSMKFRKLSGSIKSLGSLDRSLSHSSGKRTMSNSLDRSLLRQNNGSISEYGRFTLLKSTSSNKSDSNDVESANLPENQPLVQSSFSGEAEDQANQLKEHADNGLHLQDEKAGSSYSSVFEPEIEPRQNRTPDMRDSLCIIDPVITANKRRWNSQTHGSDSGVSVHSDALQGESFESNPGESRHDSIEEPKYAKKEIAPLSNSLKQSKTKNELLHSSPCLAIENCNASEIEPEIRKHEEDFAFMMTEKPVLVNDVKEVVDKPTKIEAKNAVEEKDMTMKIVVDKLEMSMDVLYEESQTCCFVEDKHTSIHFDRLDEASLTTNGEDDDIFEEAIRTSQASPIRTHQMFQFEAVDDPEVKSYIPLAGHGSADKRERVETSLRIGGPRLISVSSIESEPISPIIISINPENREFSMLEAAIEFSEDTLSTCSET